MNEKQQPLLILKRQTLAHLGAIKITLDSVTAGSLTTAGVSTLASALAGTKIALILPMIAAAIGTTCAIARLVVAHYMSISVIKNPINSSITQTVFQPEPLKSPAEPATKEGVEES